ncbi:hypothetical protein GCM10010271_23380 [Streptomyces kurssanovii]|nr:hypothetical protein GCM10010271_23380 [Streptomyces kurssanovii]
MTLRQHRTALWAALFLLIAASVVMTGVRWWEAAASDRAFCLDVTQSERCGTGPWGHASAMEMLRLTGMYGSVALLLLPLVAAAFVAGPLIAREFQSGTWRLALTQSVTPVRWFTTKLAVAAVVVLCGTVALVLAYRAAWDPVAGTHDLGWPDRGVFEATGPVLVAYGLLAVAVGGLVGQWIRRTLPAMSAAGLVTGTVMLVLGSLRWQWIPVKTLTGPFPSDPLRLAPEAFLTESGFLTADGGRLPHDACWQRTHDLGDCPADLNITGRFADYHPYAHYWQTQLVETGIVLALAAVAAYAAIRIFRRRHA